MNDAHFRFLSLMRGLPARLNPEQAAWVLNCQPHDIPTLVANRLLKPLGKPAANGVKYFATAAVLELAKDEQWLSRATLTMTEYWRRKNAVRIQRKGLSQLKRSIDEPIGVVG